MLWFDCRRYHDPSSQANLADHCGEHLGILCGLSQAAEFPSFLADLRQWMVELDNATAPSQFEKLNRGVFVCTSGTHRSVACARVAYEMLLRSGFWPSQPRHLSYGTWRRRNRCSTCKLCRLENMDKEAFFEWCFSVLQSLDYQ